MAFFSFLFSHSDEGESYVNLHKVSNGIHKPQTNGAATSSSNDEFDK